MSEKKDIADDNKKRIILKILIFLSIIMTSIGIFFFSYYSSINKVYDSYETIIVNNINDINVANRDVDEFFNSNGIIDVTYAKKQLPYTINTLAKLRDNLADSNPTSKYKKDHENLKLGLDNNLSIYKQALVILQDPSGPYVDGFSTALKNYRNDSMNFYSLVDIHNIKIELPKTSLTFIDNVLNESYTAIRIQKEDDIKSKQTQEFINKIDSISRNFSDIKINYNSYVIKIRKNDMSYNEVLAIVDTNFIKLRTVQTNFKDLSIPPSALPTYEAFKPLLVMYDDYLRDFKLALISEKIQSLSAVVVPSASDSLYTSSNVKFDELEKYYTVFIKIFIELKN